MLFVFQEEKGGPYTASIPLKQATDPDADVLLAYEMNGEVSNCDLSFHNRNFVLHSLQSNVEVCFK